MSLAIIFIGTNKYADLFPVFRDRCERFLMPERDKTYFAFTNRVDDPMFLHDNLVVTRIDHLPWPLITLLRFDFMARRLDELKAFDHVLFLDADLFPESPMTEAEWFGHGKDFVAVEHPGYSGTWRSAVDRWRYLAEGGKLTRWRRRLVRWKHDWGDVLRGSPQPPYHPPWERNPLSTACIPEASGPPRPYRQGCLWGGKAGPLCEMIEELKDAVARDFSRNLIAKFHDESHINRFFLEHESRVHTLPPTYAFPQGGSLGGTCKLMHQDKWTPEWLETMGQRIKL